jgi:hAT family C-terminal dimerisation region
MREPRFGSLSLDNDEWKRIKYLLVILKPFAVWTSALSKTRGPTIHKAWYVYSNLYTHLTKTMSQLRHKKVSWQRSVYTACENALNKLLDYYRSTSSDFNNNHIYNLANVLDPVQKLKLYKNSDLIAAEGKNFDVYEEEFRDQFTTQYSHIDNIQPTQTFNSAVHDLNTLANLQQTINKRHFDKQSSVEKYFEQYVYSAGSILEYWKAAEHTMPAMAAMARDVLAVPVSGVGVERMFNMGRDICHYRRHHLHAQSIKEVMMVKHYNRERLYDPTMNSPDCSIDDSMEDLHENTMEGFILLDDTLASDITISDEEINLYSTDSDSEQRTYSRKRQRSPATKSQGRKGRSPKRLRAMQKIASQQSQESVCSSRIVVDDEVEVDLPKLPTRQPRGYSQSVLQTRHFTRQSQVRGVNNTTEDDPYIVPDEPPTESSSYESDGLDHMTGLVKASWRQPSQKVLQKESLVSEDRDDL